MGAPFTLTVIPCGKVIACSEEEARVRRLVICCILRGNLHTVLRIVHESRYTIVRIVSRAVYPYRLAVGSSYNKFFAPVTKDISRETRRTLSGVAGVTQPVVERSVVRVPSSFIFDIVAGESV